jgi:hypothetical protein
MQSGADKKGLQEQYVKLLHAHTEEAPLTITRETVLALLRRFLGGELKADELTDWANLVELNDEFQYEPGYEKRIADALFCLSTPEINGAIDRASCQRLIEELSQS